MNRLATRSGLVARLVIPAAAAAGLFAASASAQVYAPGFVWNQNADWVPGPSAGSVAGNPSPDALGNPVWEAVWVTGDPLGGANPWYFGAATRLEWDPAWFGQAGNGNWVAGNDTAPSVGRGSFLTPGAPSAPRVAALRWIAPATLPAGILIDGYHSGGWTNNTSTYQFAIARLPGGSSSGAQLLFSDTISHIWNNIQHPVHLRVPTINAGDVIIVTARATADHGWWTIWSHDLAFKAAKAPSYPVGFAWNRRSEFVPRQPYDVNTSYGNPGLDTQDQPVWDHVYTSGGSVNSPNPWFANPGTRLVWDPAWFGQSGNGNWVVSNDTAPAFNGYTLYNPASPSGERIGVARWIAPATLAGGLRITGHWAVRWDNNSQPYEAVIARLPGGAAAGAQVLATRTFTAGEHGTQFPVDIIVPEINQGDVIAVSARATADHGWYTYFDHDLTFTHNCPDFTFPPAPPTVARRAGQSVTITAPATSVPALPAFPVSLEWRRNGVPITDGPTPHGSIISGAATDTLHIDNAQEADSGEYTCAASSSCRTSTSDPRVIAVYPSSGFTWKRSTDWTTPPASAAGTTLGNPDDDQKGTPVWECGWVTGGRLNSGNPWYYAVPTPMVWDPSWYGAPSGTWAAGNDLNPAIAAGGLTDNRVDSAGRLPIVRWTAPVDLPGVLRIEGTISITWSGGGDAPLNTAPVDFVIAKQPAAGGPPQLIWWLDAVPRQSCSFAPCPTRTYDVSTQLIGVSQGDRVIISSRAYAAVDGYSPHGWNIIGDDLTFRHVNTPVLSLSQANSACAANPRWHSGTVTCTSGDGPFTFTWYGPTGDPLPADPRFSVSTGADGRSSTLLISPFLNGDVGFYRCAVQSAWGIAASGFSVIDALPEFVSPIGDASLCGGLSTAIPVYVLSSSPTTYRWQVEDTTMAPPTFVNLSAASGIPGGPAGIDPHNVDGDVLILSRRRISADHAIRRFRCIASNACGDAASEPVTVTFYCSADVNCSGNLSVQDLFDMLRLYFEVSPAADINLSGLVSVQDLFDFFAAYFAGCS